MSLFEEPGRFSGQFLSYGYTLCATATLESHGYVIASIIKCEMKLRIHS